MKKKERSNFLIKKYSYLYIMFVEFGKKNKTRIKYILLLMNKEKQTNQISNSRTKKKL